MDDHQRLQALKDGQMAVDRAAYDQYQDHRRNVGIMDRVQGLNVVKEQQMTVDRKALQAFNERRIKVQLEERSNALNVKVGFNFQAESMKLRAKLDLAKHQARMQDNLDNGMRLEPMGPNGQNCTP